MKNRKKYSIFFEWKSQISLSNTPFHTEKCKKSCLMLWIRANSFGFSTVPFSFESVFVVECVYFFKCEILKRLKTFHLNARINNFHNRFAKQNTHKKIIKWFYVKYQHHLIVGYVSNVKKELSMTLSTIKLFVCYCCCCCCWPFGWAIGCRWKLREKWWKECAIKWRWDRMQNMLSQCRWDDESHQASERCIYYLVFKREKPRKKIERKICENYFDIYTR